MSRAFVPLVALLAAPAAAQQFSPPDAVRNTVTSALRVYTDPVVQAELKLTEEQKAKLAKIPDEVLTKNKDAIEKQAVADEEAAAKTAALRADVEKQFDALLEKHLTAAQRARVNQLLVQARGMTAFRDEPVIKALGLPADAQATLNDFVQAGLDKLRAEYPDGSPREPEAARTYADFRRKMQQGVIAKFVGTLTDEQKKAWKELIGEPSDAVLQSFGFRPTARLTFLFSPVTRVSNLHALVSNAKVLDELKVEKAARNALGEGLKAVEKAARDAGPPRGSAGPRSSIAYTLGTEASAAAAAVLTAPQVKRFEQIQFQLRGTDVFTSGFAAGVFPEIGLYTVAGRGDAASPLRKLTVTPAQVVKIDAVLADAVKKRRPLGSPPMLFGRTEETDAKKAARQAWQRQVAEIEKAALTDIVATFDAGQKAVWKEFSGEPIDAAKVEAYAPIWAVLRLPIVGPDGRSLRQGIVYLWVQEAAQRVSVGEYAAALALYDEAIRLAPGDPQLLQYKADLLATCPSDWVRDGKQAVELMTKVMAQTKEPTHTQHATLAAALAEVGRFEEAVAAQVKAIATLPQPPVGDPNAGGFSGFGVPAGLKTGYEAELKLYRAKKPYRTTLRAEGS